MTYEEELEIQVSIDRMKKALAALAKNLSSNGFKKLLEEQYTLEEKISRWEKRLKNYQEKNLPLILQENCLKNIIKYKMEKIYKDHC